MNLENIQAYLQSLKSPFCIVLIGPPLSGKDTFISRLNISNVSVISRDDIVLDLCPNLNYNQAWKTVDQKLVDKTLKSKLLQYISDNKNVIINLTNLRRKSRKSFLLKFGINYKKIAIIFPILTSDEYARRNTVRTENEGKSISMKVINEMIDGYEAIDETENFDKVFNLKY